MLTNRQLFFQHVGQTSPAPLALEIERAEGVYMYATDGKKYLDLVSGVSVSNVGHCHPKVVDAVKRQVEKYMHLMVYGEFIQYPQVAYAKKLTEILPQKLDAVYFLNSGSEAVEGAMKLAKRYTGRQQIFAFKNAYHGSTHGAMSLMHADTYTQAFRPLLPDIQFLDYNDLTQLHRISEKTAGVVVEFVQGEGGVVAGQEYFIKALRKRCSEVGCLLIADEVQTGFGRTGKLFAFEHYDTTPDILVTAKGMGAGMPISAFIAEKKVMDTLTYRPVLGHITTFGGHPVSAAAALAGLEVLLEENLAQEAERKGELYVKHLKKHPKIKGIRGKGLFLAVQTISGEFTSKLIEAGLELGFVSDPFLFEPCAFRIAPPLIISDEEIMHSIDLIIKALDRC